MWWGDARIQFQVTAHAYGDVTLFERGLGLVARSKALDGSLHAHPPSDAPNHRLPDFMMTWIMSLWDHYFHTGRKDVLEECKTSLLGVISFLQSHTTDQGLVGGFEGMWVFLDWQNLFKSNYSAVLNLMYLQALRSMDKLFSDPKLANFINSLESAIVKYFWDERAGLWRDGWDVNTGQMVDSVSQHANALAILLDLKPETHHSIAKNVLLKAADSRRSKILTASPFFYAYVLEALAKAGLRDDVIRIIRVKWGEMIDKGATTFWEVWEPTYHSRCHAWSASPVYHLMQQVLGVMPVEPGWKRVRIAPCPANLDYARGKVPSPLGLIQVEWERAAEDQLAVRVELPEGMQAEFVSPAGTARQLRTGSQEFST
jgi:hypothetical protein